MMIKEGDKPGDESGGGFAAQKVVEWIEEWQACQKVYESEAEMSDNT